jgi:hypothetical protein
MRRGEHRATPMALVRSMRFSQVAHPRRTALTRIRMPITFDDAVVRDDARRMTARKSGTSAVSGLAKRTLQ